MRQTIATFTVVFALAACATTPTFAAEFRKLPNQSGTADVRLRSTPDIDNGNGDVNTDPAMTASTDNTKPSATDGNACRSNGGQGYPNANTDNPPGLQPCPQ